MAQPQELASGFTSTSAVDASTGFAISACAAHEGAPLGGTVSTSAEPSSDNVSLVSALEPEGGDAPLEVAVPDGCDAGASFLVELVDGRQVAITVPEGCGPGMLLSVAVPPAEMPAPLAVAQPVATSAEPSSSFEVVCAQPSADELLEMLRVPSSSSGFFGVTLERNGSTTRPYLAQIRRGTRQVKLGRFETAAQAARAYAEAMGPDDIKKLTDSTAKTRQCQLTAEESRTQAEAEGLTLHVAPGTKTGFKGVTEQKRSASHPFTAVIYRDGASVHLGCFATREQAALEYARAFALRPATTEHAAPASLTIKHAQPQGTEEALAAAAAAGLTLQLAPKTQTGFKGVWKTPKSRSRPFRAEFRTRKLGGYATAEGAALAFARAAAAHAAAPCSSGRRCTCVLPWLEVAANADASAGDDEAGL